MNWDKLGLVRLVFSLDVIAILVLDLAISGVITIQVLGLDRQGVFLLYNTVLGP